MLKYSFMTFSCPELTLDGVLALAKRLGYDGVEPRIEAKHQHGIELEASTEQRAQIRRQVAASGVALACVATSRTYANPETVKDQIELTRRCIDLAADVGAPRIRVFGGVLAPGLAREAAIELVATALLAVADFAKERKVTVCIETHDDWSDPRHLAEVLKRVNHPAIAVNWDILHPFRGAGMQPEQSYAVVKPWVQHLHIHDMVFDEKRNLQSSYIGEGAVDHRAAVRILKGISYAGYLSGEWIGRQEPYADYLARELATLKRYEREG